MTPSERRRTKSPFLTCSGISISSRNSVMGKSFFASIRPVLDPQARHLAEILQVAADKCAPVGQGDGGYQEVGPADLLELLVFSQPVELGCGPCINGQDRSDGGQ